MSTASEPIDIVVEIIANLRQIHGKPLSALDPDDPMPIPRFIAGDNGSIIINRKVSHLIFALSSSIGVSYIAEHGVISNADWASIVQRVLGPALSKVDFAESDAYNGERVLKKVFLDLSQSEWNFRTRKFYFGCSFINPELNHSFRVGCVSITPREVWLKAEVETGKVSTVAYRRILAHWKGRKVRSRKNSKDYRNENEIIKMVGPCSYVMEVTVKGIFGDFAKQRAVMCAHFILGGAALIWARPSKALENMNLLYDGQPFLQSYAFQHSDSEILGGSKWVRGQWGQQIIDESWEEVANGRSNWWSALAEILEHIASPKPGAVRQDLLSRFAQALKWFEEACREQGDMGAVAKFMATLDTLSGGRRAKGIVSFICARLNVSALDAIRPEGPTFQTHLTYLYDQGRSRIFHGSSDRFGHDWSTDRAEAETFARIGLVTGLEWLACNPDAERITDMSLQS